jgi:hypothetical protein
MIVYISIGNSDDKLLQREWAAYAGGVLGAVRQAEANGATTHGSWTSLPFSAFQNACWCVEIRPEDAEALKAELRDLADIYRQDSVAWAEAPVTEFLRPKPMYGAATIETSTDGRTAA